MAVGATGAHAAPGDSAEAEGQWLSGSLLESVDLEDLVSLGGVEVSNDGTQDDQVESEGLAVGLLGDGITLDLGDGIEIPLGFADETELGVLSQYAFAGDDATALGSSGVLTNQGAIDIPGAEGAPTMATVSLGDLLGSEFEDAIAGLELNVGAVSAAAQVEEGAVPTGEYHIAAADVTLDSPLVEEIATQLGTVIEDTDDVVDAAIGADGVLDEALADLTDIVEVLLPAAEVEGSAAVDLDLISIGDSLIGAPLTDEDYATTIDLSTGSIVVDLAVLHEINGLDPNTDLLSPGALEIVSEEVGLLLDALMDAVVTQVNDALEAAEVTVAVTADLPALPAVNVSVNDSLGNLATGESGPEAVTTNIGDELIDTLLSEVVSLVLPPLGTLAGDLLDEDDGPLVGLGDTLAGVITPLVDELAGEEGAEGVIALVGDVVQLTANVQSPAPAEQDETFEVIGLQISVLPTELVPELAQLNLARGLVTGTAADSEPDPDAATLTGIDPDEGPLEGGNPVTITGEDFGDDPTVIVDGTDVPAADVTVNADDTLTVTMPAGDLPGPVTVTVDNGNGPAAPLTYTYLADPDAATDIILDPNEGPLEGGNDVVIAGEDLGDDPTVIVDGTDVPAADVTINPDGTITIVMPPGTAPGPVDVVVDNGNGPSEPATYTYLADDPGDGDIIVIINNVAPDSGPTDGGTTVVVEGDNFDLVTDVTIGGISVDWELQPDGSITFVTPPHGAGAAEIILSAASGDALAYFTYEADTGPGPGGPGGLPVTGATVPTQMVGFALLLLATGGGLTLSAIRKRALQA